MERPARVLIVDDRNVVRQTVKSTLLGFKCVFSEAEDGATGLRLMQEQKFDVIFLDLKLPDLSGIEVLERAQRFDPMPGRFIVMTGFPDAETMEAAKKLGAEYITKDPLDWDLVRIAFANAASNNAPPPSAPSPNPNLTLALHSETEGYTDNAIELGDSHDLHPRILILDDNPDWLDCMEEVLGSEFCLEKTPNCGDALRLASKENFALVVLDLRLGDDVSGLDVLSQMRRTNPALRAIILTGYPSPPTAFVAGQRGALDYVSKGDLSAFPATIRRILAAVPIRVFLSYERKDQDTVGKLFDRLTEHAFLPWMDVKSIGGGVQWEAAVREAIAHADKFVYCHSSHSLYKEGVMRKELKWALEKQEGLMPESVFFIPARLENCEITGEIRRFQYIDLFKPEGFRQLLKALSSGRNSGE